ncbi:response regulator transcription factor [Elusimicrobiota bacterium]
MSYKIIIIEDEPTSLKTLGHILQSKNYNTEAFDCGTTGLKAIKQYPPDLIILDLELPDIDGIEICRQIKEDKLLSNIPIIMVTGRYEIEQKVSGLKCGADDYLVKPYSNEELLARVESVLRRVHYKGSLEEIIIVEEITLDISRKEVKIEGNSILLPSKQFCILKFMMENPARTLSKDYILNNIWGFCDYIGKRTIDYHICEIRKKLGEKSAKRIKTVYNEGYMFIDGPISNP